MSASAHTVPGSSTGAVIVDWLRTASANLPDCGSAVAVDQAPAVRNGGRMPSSNVVKAAPSVTGPGWVSSLGPASART